MAVLCQLELCSRMRHEELRAAADKMLSLIDRLEAIERAKQQLLAGSDEFVRLAEEAERQARVIQRWSVHQLELARVAERERMAAQRTALTDVQPRQLDRILADWREAEMRLETAEAGSEAAQQATRDAERLRAEYHAAEGDKRRQ